jgi:hypothetical protein
MRKAEIFIALLLLCVGAITLVDSVRLGFGWGMSGPESGFFPFYLGLGQVICSALVLLNVIKKYKKERTGKRLMPEGALKPILWILIPATVMIVITEFVGLHIAAAIYLAFYMRASEKVGWITVILVSVLVPAGLYIAFDKLFLVPLPQGLWGAKLIPF